MLPAAEINSSFYRPHRASTYERWAASTPPGFRFSVKLPKTITHTARLASDTATLALLDAFLAEIAGLGGKLGCLLAQLAPSLRLDAPVTERFLAELRARHDGPVAVEPRHATWFTSEGDALLQAARVGRVSADPPRAPGDGAPGGWPGTVYHRWHGSPRIYYSAYESSALRALAGELARAVPGGAPPWCIFDNTALGAATANALEVLELVAGSRPRRDADRGHARPE